MFGWDRFVLPPVVSLLSPPVVPLAVPVASPVAESVRPAPSAVAFWLARTFVESERSLRAVPPSPDCSLFAPPFRRELMPEAVSLLRLFSEVSAASASLPLKYSPESSLLADSSVALTLFVNLSR